MAAANAVYNVTTVQEPKAGKWLIVPSEYLDKWRFGIKVAAVLFSLLAFILAATVYLCSSCPALYFFQFTSCAAFLFTGLLVFFLATPFHRRVGISDWPMLDFSYTVAIGFLIFLASAAFASEHRWTLEVQMSVAFGFIACVLFLVDAVIFVKIKGWPCHSKPRAPPEQSETPEAEKLTVHSEE
ncbi:CKLF-like MARVEL transmembrane domain-containing protein 6 isoform X4 [Brienomyrus brachyistius]|uniref:CKLF-like MARVEL transmembrane domain-containing protein 6 isoform X4 n=1 Tax=Brienomyrus brachyistius TaxID=42636 RepID=UPI0020B1A5B9|nr:CKLF-like MARVEL transmembrane domain-containing protein 6 isoform X4 [Brienomyrus brachyistius]